MAKVKTAHERAIEKIIHEDYIILPSKRTTVCEITLLNGFTVRGESSVVDIANFDQKLGETIARDQAIDEICKLEAYLIYEENFNRVD